jgi:hypothetical protein
VIVRVEIGIDLQIQRKKMYQITRKVTKSTHFRFLPFNRTEFDLQVDLRVDLQNRDIERPLLEVCPDGQGRFLNDISFPVLDRLQVRKDFPAALRSDSRR